MALYGYTPNHKKALWVGLSRSRAPVSSKKTNKVREKYPKKRISPRTPKNVTTRRIGRSKGIRRRSPKLERENKAYLKVRKQFLLKHPLCVGCSLITAHYGLPVLGRVSFATDVHHYRGKLKDLRCEVKFFIPLCRSCHSWVGDHPDAARTLNLLCPKGSWNKQP